MTNEQRYTAQEMREVERDLCVLRYPQVEVARRMLRYAAGVVERCEKKRADIMARTFRHDVGWMDGDDRAVYNALGDALRGDAGNGKRV